ncbi:MAG: hypothetical protein RRC34_06200 [Lentisphaeria bacterium]|nr:hypothetical protein [Lentisphaeria bacterium]
MTRPPPPSPPDLFSIPFKTPAPKVTLAGLFRTLFFNPLNLVFYLSGEKLGRSLFRVVTIAFLCGLFLSVARVPMISREVRAWTDWLQTEMADVAFRDGELSWTPAEALPYSRHFRDWRVTFSDKPAAEFDPLGRYGPEPKGVWISPQALIIWQRVEGRDALARQRLSMETAARAVATSQQADADQESLHVVFDQRGRLFVMGMLAAGLGGTTILGILGDVLFYSLLLTVIPFMLRGNRKNGAFFQAMTFYLNVSLVPLLVATVYSLTGVPVLDFNSVFSFSFMGYILFVIFGTRWRLRRVTLKEGNR